MCKIADGKIQVHFVIYDSTKLKYGSLIYGGSNIQV